MKIKLPAPIATYVAAIKNREVASLADCFDADARVKDEGHEYIGIDAIQAWKKDADQQYSYTMDLLDLTHEDDRVCLHARLTGDFPGSPIDLDFNFVLSADRITSLEIG